MCSQQSKGAKYPQKSFNCADTFSLKITRFHAALKPIFRSLKPFQAFSSLLNLGARDFSFYMNTHNEKTPHMHLSFVPLTADGRLSAKEIVGNKKKLTQWQDKFWEHMVRKYPDLERGESASQTGRDHIPPRVFKEMTRLTKQKAKLEELLAGIGAFNAKSRAAEIAALLDKYIPAVEKMHSTMKKYQVAFTETTVENKKLKQENAHLEQSLEKATQESTLKQLADAKLRRDYDDAVAVLERIPKEVLDVYTCGSGRKERPIEQNL